MNRILPMPTEERETPTRVYEPRWYDFLTGLQATARVALFFLFLSVGLTTAVFFSYSGIYTTAGVGLAFATLKEFWYDRRIQHDSLRTSTFDFLVCMLGILGAVLLFSLAVHLHRLWL